MAKKKETAKRTCTATELPDDPHRTKKKKKNDDEVYVVEDIVDFRTKGKQITRHHARAQQHSAGYSCKIKRKRGCH